jgi:cytidine deaminase
MTAVRLGEAGEDEQILTELAELAWRARDHAYMIGNTSVGCALLTDDERRFAGCNVEHRFRSHDIHAEVNAIGTMVAAGGRKITHLAVVAQRTRFTPCGACMDWIMQFATDECRIAFQGEKNGPIEVYTADQLMPYYPH